MTSNKFRMLYKVDGNPQLDSRDWSIYSNILKFTLDASKFHDPTPNSFKEVKGKRGGGGRRAHVSLSLNRDTF